jgi:hypothetical protein
MTLVDWSSVVDESDKQVSVDARAQRGQTHTEARGQGENCAGSRGHVVLSVLRVLSVVPKEGKDADSAPFTFRRSA